jgi:predicted permease
VTASDRAPAWRRYLRFWGSNVAGDVDDELRFHIEMRVGEYMARGLSPDDARRAALLRVGSITAARDECLLIGRERERHARGAALFGSIGADIGFALRALRRTPGWTTIAVLTIALGIGASTAVFSVVDRLLVRPIAYPGAARMLIVERDISVGPDAHVLAAPAPEAIRAWRRSAHSIEAVEAYARRELRVSSGDSDDRTIRAAAIDSSFLEFAGVRPLIGRGFSNGETVRNGPPVVLLAENYWRREFGAARDIVGRPLRASGQAFTIIGVLPAALQLPDVGAESPGVWLPLVDGGERLAFAVVRLRPAVSIDVARSELDAIATHSGADRGPVGLVSTLKLFRPGETVRFRRALTMFAGAVALLLLVACANIAHLLLARGAARERELAVRYALGAGRMRLVRQLLTESLVLLALGGVAAFAVGLGCLQAVRRLHPATLSALSHVASDQNILIIACALTFITGLGLGVFVGLRTAREGLAEALRAGGGGGRRGRRLRSSLVVTEIALSATLLVGALLLVRSVINLQNTQLGFDARNLYGITFSLRNGPAATAAARSAFTHDLLARGRQLLGTNNVTLAATIPPNGGFVLGAFETADNPGQVGSPQTVSANEIAPDYLSVMAIALREGRTFDASSAANKEVIVNEALARQLWPTSDALGRRFRVTGAWWTVVGVTRDAFSHGLLDEKAEPAIYSPLGSLEDGRVTLIVRAPNGVDPTPALRQLAASLRPGTAIPTITSVEQSLSDSMAEPRFSMLVLATFAGLAVILAAIGLYGVISYSVAQRTKEIGIRVTLGATRSAIARLVVGDGLRLALLGVVLGLCGAMAGTRLIQAALYGVQRGDPVSFVVGAAVLMVVSTAACILPTLRATSVDPVVAVRTE